MEAIRGTSVESLDTLNIQYCIDEITRLVDEPERTRSLAKLAVQVAMESSFTERNHIYCALPEKPGRSWYGTIKKVRHEKFGDTRGFDPAGYELEAIMQDVDGVIWRENG